MHEFLSFIGMHALAGAYVPGLPMLIIGPAVFSMTPSRGQAWVRAAICASIPTLGAVLFSFGGVASYLLDHGVGLWVTVPATLAAVAAVVAYFRSVLPALYRLSDRLR